MLADLCEAINNDRLPPLVQAALVHAQFEAIHPFADGNGRTGRALVQVIFKRRQLAPDYLPPISVVLATARERYIAGLTRFRGNEVTAWGVLIPLSASRRNRAWEAEGLLDLMGGLESGVMPAS